MTAALTLAWSCGGGGGSSGGSSTSELTVQASFAPSTREVPGYADTLSVKVVPPAGVQLPGTFPNPFQLTRNNTSMLLSGLVRSAVPYRFEMEALTGGEVVGTAVRTIVVNTGSPPPIDVSANMQSEIDSVAIEGVTSMVVDQVRQLTAYCVNSEGQTLFSGLGFLWTSSAPTVVYVGSEDGACVPRAVGESTIHAQLVGTTKGASVEVDVVAAGQIGVAVSPEETVMAPYETIQFSAIVSGASWQGIEWTVEEPDGGSIDATGLYTAPSNNGVYHVRATSEVDGATYANALVVVSTEPFWSIVDLHPLGAFQSAAVGVRDGQQVGSVMSRPSLWSGSAATFVDLSPVGTTFGAATGASNGRQVGHVEERAYIWAGSASSIASLHPAGATSSRAYGIDGDYQVGYATIGGDHHAALWNGSAQTFVDLHPAGYTWSEARSVSGDQQGGFVETAGGAKLASIWSKTAASHVILDPGTERSEVLGVADGFQVGIVYPIGEFINVHASQWTGTAGSWIDIHPVGAELSHARATSHGNHVGTAQFGGIEHAYFWQSDGTRVDLHTLLPTTYVWSVAHGIWINGTTTHIAGYGYDSMTDRIRAIMWIRTEP